MASLTTTSITGDLTVSGNNNIIPPGSIAIFSDASTRVGYIECNGAVISRTAYAALFAAIGTTYGAGNGSTTFAVPDLRGEFIRGWDHGRAVDISRGLGTFQADELRTHRHTTINIRGDAGDNAGQSAFGEAVTTSKTGTVPSFYLNVPQAYSSFAGGSETRPRNIAMMFCIKY